MTECGGPGACQRIWIHHWTCNRLREASRAATTKTTCGQAGVWWDAFGQYVFCMLKSPSTRIQELWLSGLVFARPVSCYPPWDHSLGRSLHQPPPPPPADRQTDRTLAVLTPRHVCGCHVGAAAPVWQRPWVTYLIISLLSFLIILE